MRRDFLLFILSILLALGVAALVWEYADARAGPFPVPFTDADGKPSLVRLYVDAGGEAFYVPLYALLAGAFLLAAIVGRAWLAGAHSYGALWRRGLAGLCVLTVAGAAVVWMESSGPLSPGELLPGEAASWLGQAPDEQPTPAPAERADEHPPADDAPLDSARTPAGESSAEIDDAAAYFELAPSCPLCSRIGVQRVVDGDTLVSSYGRIRLYGVDTPEIGEPCAGEATALLRRLAGSRARVQFGPRMTDRYDRTLAYLYTEDGFSIDGLLVWGGYGYAWTSDGQHAATLAALERDARRSGRGCLWARPNGGEATGSLGTWTLDP